MEQSSAAALDNQSDEDAINISVAVPVYNEETTVEELLGRIGKVLDTIAGEHQIVIVDDGSTDSSFAILEAAAKQDSRILAVALSRNFGHQVAISAALDHSCGDVVVVMDGDLQDPPESIPLFLNEYRQGYDVVYAVRTHRKENIVKRTCYKAFYRLLSVLAHLEIPLDAGDFALMSRRVVDLVRNSHERQRYLRGLRTWYGFEQKGIPTARDARHSGQSKYSLGKLLRLALDGIFAFSIVPIRMAMLAGVIAVGCSLLYALYALYVKFYFDPSQQAPPGFTALILTITFLSGMNLLFAGIIGEYIGRIYEEVKQRPHYVVKRTIGKVK